MLFFGLSPEEDQGTSEHQNDDEGESVLGASCGVLNDADYVRTDEPAQKADAVY